VRHEHLVYDRDDVGLTGTTFGRVLPPRGYRPPILRRRPRLPGAPLPEDPTQVVDWIVGTFESQGKSAGLQRAALFDRTYRTGGAYLDGAGFYLAQRTADRAALQSSIAQLNASLVRAATVSDIRVRGPFLLPQYAAVPAYQRYRRLEARKRFLERRLIALPEKPQAVADLPEVAEKKDAKPDWLPYVSLGLAVAGFTMALRGRK
jgi:hypothetical protein